MENMFSDADEIRARCRSTPTIAERRESETAIEISEMRISHNGTITADVGVQVNSNGPIFQFPAILPETPSLGQYSDSPQGSTADRSPPQSHSMPQSPYATSGISTSSRQQVGSGQRVVSWGKGSMANGDTLRIQREQQRVASHMGSSPQLRPAHNNLQSTDIMIAESVSTMRQLDQECTPLWCVNV